MEEALVLKETYNAEVVVVSMGPVEVKKSLREALAMGADKAILVNDEALEGSDTWATATTITSIIEKLGNYDIIFCGTQATDGNTGQVGPEIAEFLDIPQITYVKKLQIDEDKVIATRFTEYGNHVIEAKMPVLLTAINGLNKPRYPNVMAVMKSHSAEKDGRMIEYNLEDLEVDTTQIGLKGSPTKVLNSFIPERENVSEILEGSTAKEKTDKLVRRLSRLNVV